MGVKLIAMDLDGTLLRDGLTEPSAEALELIRELLDRGVHVAAASGRSYPNLKYLFGPVAGDLFFICENGNLVMYDDRRLYSTPLDRGTAMGIISDIQSLADDCEAVTCCQGAYWLVPKRKRFLLEMLYKWGMTVRVVADKEHISDEILKVSLWTDGELREREVSYLRSRWSGKVCHIAPSGPMWLDFTDGCKGDALLFTAGMLGVSREETAAFGDNYNDIEMLDAAGLSYAMDTAADEVKAHAAGVCLRVEDELRKLLDMI